MSTVYVGIGSNLGNRRKNCNRAVKLLEEKGIVVKKRSSVYETEPWGVKEQPLFLNMAVEIETALPPRKLLDIIRDIEKEVGRERTFHWGPRIIDLDILLYNNRVILERQLKIPHPFLHRRAFVLKPLDEIAPDIMHPVLKISVHEMLQRIEHRAENSHVSP
jgi:2-amino-4-hydroxy-6-hydroxymethyldihydropteridine diphosphokinase